MTAVTSGTAASSYVESKDRTAWTTGTGTMEHREDRAPDWRELASYSAFATALTVLNVSIAMLLGF